MAIPGGPTLIGSHDADPSDCGGDPSANDENCDEVPQGQTDITAFSVEIHEVTNAQYRGCVEAGRCSAPFSAAAVPGAERFDDPAFAQHPVVFVGQPQAAAYCAWAGRRLPTEFEWEAAARGAAPLVERRYPWGDERPDCERANLGRCHDGTEPAGHRPGDVSSNGVLDLAGNVHEVTAGWYGAAYYRRLPDRDPPGPERGEMALVPVRGGAYDTVDAFSTITYRGFRVLMTRQDRGRGSVGFRCVAQE